MAGRYSAVPTAGQAGTPPPGNYQMNQYPPGARQRPDLDDDGEDAPMMANAGGRNSQGQRVNVPPPRGTSSVPNGDRGDRGGGGGGRGGGGRTGVRFDSSAQPPPQDRVGRMATISSAQPGFKRSKTKKSFALTPKGNLQVDIKVPPKLIEGSSLTGWETEYLRYTAPACDPDEFARQGFTLRPKEHSTPRQIELAICCTMYNESPELFAKSWEGLVHNLTYLMGKTRSPIWGPESWKKIVIVVVSDGRAQINKQTLSLLGLLGLYQEGIVVGTVPNKFPSQDGSNDEAKVSAHIFEYTTQVMVDESLRLQNTIPIQTIFCLKEANAKKINSHRWFFHAFCPILQPRVTILLDVGTRPLDKAIYYLWKVFDKHPNVGGACGEIRAELGPWWKNAINPLVAAQNFEY
ncbi:Chitin synthase, class 1, partial [Gonapodya sp. JEL0774]